MHFSKYQSRKESDPELDPDPLVRRTDPGIRTPTKMSRSPTNTDPNYIPRAGPALDPPGVSGKGNRFNTRWRQNTETNGHQSPRSEANIYHLTPSRPPFFLITPYRTVNLWS